MTPEEKAAVMQLMGQTYGQMHKQDQMIVGESNNLSHQSNNMRQVFEQTAQLPTMQPGQPGQQPPEQQATEQQAPVLDVAPVSPEQAAQEIAAQRAIRTEQPPVAEEVNPNQVEFDFSEPTKVDQLIDLIKD